MAGMDSTTLIGERLIQPKQTGNLIVNRAPVGYQLAPTMSRFSESAARPAPVSRAEHMQVTLLLAAFLLVNLLTAARYPFVWIDEVMFSDPAVNLLLGNGFTSSAWYGQPSDAFWAGNVPLHPWLLWGWLKVFGFSITAVRSVNFVYVTAAALLLWRGIARTGLIATGLARLAFLVLLLGGYSLIFSYRSGRYDALLLVAALFWMHTIANPRCRIAGLFVLSCLVPWVGLQLLPFLAVTGLLLLVFVGWQLLPQLTAAGVGTAAGAGALMLFYRSQGVWESFLGSIRQHTTVGFFEMLFSGEFRHSNLLPKDFSFWPVFGLAILLTGCLLAQRRLRWRSPLAFGLIHAVVLSLTLVVSGKFPTYYGWMTYVPLCMCVCATLSSHQFPGWLRGISGFALSAAFIVGIGTHLAVAAYDWSDRDYAPVTQFTCEHVKNDDWLHGDHVVYYAAKPVAARVFMPYYLPAMRESEKQRVSVLVIAPDSLTEAVQGLGGDWVSTGARLSPKRGGLLGNAWKRGFLSAPNHELEVFRRTGPTP